MQETHVVILLLFKGAITPYWVIAAGETGPGVSGESSEKSGDIDRQRRDEIDLGEVQRDRKLEKREVSIVLYDEVC